MELPSIGRMVVYKNFDGVEYPAVVLSVLESGAVNLSVFKHNGVVTSVYNVEYDPDRMVCGYWHWPRRLNFDL
jgi:hypothetical protein